MTDVLYFMAPTEESVKLVIKDFPEQDEFDYDQYGTVHLAFCGPCPDKVLSLITQAPKLASRIASLFEANLDFSIFTDNVFLAKPLPYFAGGRQSSRIPDLILDSNINKKLVSRISDQLLTLCSCLSEKPFI